MFQSINQNSVECNRFLQEPCFRVLHALISVLKSGVALRIAAGVERYLLKPR